MRRGPVPRPGVTALTLGLAVVLASPAVTAAPTPFADYLATWNIARADRASLEPPGAWSPEKQATALRVLGRLARVPANLAMAWNAEAIDLRAVPVGERLQDRLVRVTGTATFVAVLPLPEDAAALAGRKAWEQVRIVADDGLAVDVLADHVPEAWPRDTPIQEPTVVIGLPLADGPGPAAPPGGAAPVDVLLAAARVGWFPPTPLGGPAAVAGPPADIVPLINPQGGWFTRHRGEPVTVEGVARRATRIEIDDPFRRQQVGVDHYWELYVFVPTPLLEVHDRLQEDYPVVCCVRTLPDGMPTGPQIGERVRVTGFALKRYRYPLPDVKISSSRGESERQGLRQDTCLLVGGAAVWRPQATPDRAIDTLGWVFTGLAALIGAALAVAAWA
ncbi:MAG: hypothetical protein EBX36_01400, partial [Planctomycetia bacterium]|nr:hypothetical protein [Planctomycetia bacterium]